MPIFTTLKPFILGSASPRREELLASIGLNFTVIPASGEAQPEKNEPPEAYARRAAAGKALAVQNSLDAGKQCLPILSADTIVVLDKNILGKPKSHGEAFEMLCKLAGRTHTVITACALRQGRRLNELSLHSQVTMWDTPAEILRRYADGVEPMDKAGAYAAQGQGAFLIRAISGSWSNVVGLPLSEVTELLLKHGIIA
jgi:septum formation protein